MTTDFDDIMKMIKNNSNMSDALDNSSVFDSQYLETLKAAALNEELDNFEICAAVAVDKNGVIGINDDLPWSLKDDLSHFKELTKKSCVIMGRKTFDSLPFKHGLPYRCNYVITRDDSCAFIPKILSYDKSLVVKIGDLELAIKSIQISAKIQQYIAKHTGNDVEHSNGFDLIYDKVFIIGGSQLFNLAKNLSSDSFITRMYVTEVDAEVEYDSSDKVSTFHFDKELIWKEVNRVHYDKSENNEYAFDIVEYERQCNILGI